MVYEYRSSVDYYFGTLQTAAAVSDTTLSAAAFATLPSTFSTTSYLPVVLHDPALGYFEVVWVTAHTAASTSVTVVRGRQGTTARAWPSGTQILNAPTVRDGLMSLTRATLPTDAHVGMRAAVNDEGIVVQRAFLGSRWEADLGVALPSEFGYRWDGSAIPANAVLTMRGGKATGTTDSLGKIIVPFKTPFPNQCLSATASWHSGTGIGNIGMEVPTASNVGVYLFNDSGTNLGAGVSLTFTYLAVGY